MHYNYLADMVQKLVRTYGTRDPFELAKALNIEVVYSDLGSLKGMYTVILRNRFIVISERVEESVAKIICAHELAHDRLHRELASKTPFREFSLYRMESKPEYEANAFAAHLLIDSRGVLQCALQGMDVKETASFLQTDVNLLLIKMNELNKMGASLEMPYLPKSNFLSGQKAEF